VSSSPFQQRRGAPEAAALGNMGCRSLQGDTARNFLQRFLSSKWTGHDTVLGYDKIAVLGAGRILEYGSPAELLRMQRGELRRLVDADSLSKRKGSKNGTETLVAAA
jgi:hypothetical protein